MSGHASRLPAAPLVAVVDRLLHWATGGELAERGKNSPERTAVFERIGVDPHVVWAWRKPGARVGKELSDRVLSASPYLWFDVWDTCSEHPRPVYGCDTCTAHYRARLVFTGVPMPRALETPAKEYPPRPCPHCGLLVCAKGVQRHIRRAHTGLAA
jgi:hypothetical protein